MKIIAIILQIVIVLEAYAHGFFCVGIPQG